MQKLMGDEGWGGGGGGGGGLFFSTDPKCLWFNCDKRMVLVYLFLIWANVSGDV